MMMFKNKKFRFFIFMTVLLITVFSLWLILGNIAVEIDEYTVSSDKIPSEISGFRIAHISDLHNAQIGENNEKLLSLISETEPDIIAITGDIIDSRRTDVSVAISFAEKAVKIAPCYYVTGNHEARVADYAKLREGLIKLGVTVLDNKKTVIEKNGEKIMLIGVDDPDFRTDYLFDDPETVMRGQLEELVKKGEGYTVLLSHRPEFFDLYTELGVNLVLSGHAHGGQFRLPFIGGFFAPSQGFFPEYDSGLYSADSTDMLVSRGIGNSIIPLRVNNRPEVVVVELQNEDKLI